MLDVDIWILILFIFQAPLFRRERTPNWGCAGLRILNIMNKHNKNIKIY
jgi:hypothetical protein